MARDSGLIILGTKILPTRKRATVASEVACKTSIASVYRRGSRLDSYSSKKANSPCQIATRVMKSTKLRTEVRIARNLVTEIALTVRRRVMEAATREPTKNVKSKSLNRIDRT